MRNPKQTRFHTRSTSKSVCWMLVVVVLLMPAALACNIPVFRYALERWRSDKLEVLVFSKGELDTQSREQLAQLQRQAVTAQGDANLEVRRIVLGNLVSPDDRAVWDSIHASLPEVKPPYAVVRGRHHRGRFVAWHGPLSQADLLVGSPIRRELGRRLTKGDAIVWLVVASKQDESANQQIVEKLKEQAEELSRTLELPEGIGLPGSELFSEVPLLLQFSVLSIDREDSQEAFLIELFKQFQPEAFEEDQPLVVPVFGRGRALEVIPAEQLNAALMRDLTGFLCAACSCQVKEQNPGFDLLLDVAWDKQLFGEGGVKPPASTADGLHQQQPTLLTIPPGRSK